MVLNPDALLDVVSMECLQIEPLGQSTVNDTVVYSGIHVYLKRAALNRSLFGTPAAHRRELAKRYR